GAISSARNFSPPAVFGVSMAVSFPTRPPRPGVPAMASCRNPLVLLACVLCVVASAHAAEHQTKLERLPDSPSVLKPPAGLDNVTVAKTAPQIDFAVFPNQWDGAKLWSSWGDALRAADGKFYASV